MYYIIFNGESIGPMSANQVASYPVDSNTMVSAEGGNWQPLYNYPELMEAINIPKIVMDDKNPSEGTKNACGILAIILGGFGLHYFLVGKVGGGFINIILSLCSCGLWSVINLIQGIMILCMSYDEWKAKWVDNPSNFPVF